MYCAWKELPVVLVHESTWYLLERLISSHVVIYFLRNLNHVISVFGGCMCVFLCLCFKILTYFINATFSPLLTLAMNSNLISYIYFCLSFLDIEPITYKMRIILAIASIKVAWGINCFLFLFLTSLMELSTWSMSLVFNSWSTLGLTCLNIAVMAQLLYCFWNLICYIKPSSHCDFSGYFCFLLMSVNSSVPFSNLLVVVSAISGIQFILTTEVFFYNWWMFISNHFCCVFLYDYSCLSCLVIQFLVTLHNCYFFLFMNISSYFHKLCFLYVHVFLYFSVSFL